MKDEKDKRDPVKPSRRWLSFILHTSYFLLLVSPFWRRGWRRQSARLTVFAAYSYCGVLFGLLALENVLLFHPTTAAQSWRPPPEGLRVEEVELTSADGTFIHGWWAAPVGWGPSQGAAVYFHGNAGNVSNWGGEGVGLDGWQALTKTGMLVFDYPGFGKSGGRPTEAGCYAAADAVFDWLTTAKQVPAERIVLLARSLGCGVAVDLASRRPCRALILYSPFLSFPDLAQEKYPWLPARWLVHNQFDNVGKIRRVRAPVLIAHGTADALIPYHHGEDLYAAASEPKQFLPMPGRGHNGHPTREYLDAVRRFLDETAPLPKGE